jgi:hypothetical protein
MPLARQSGAKGLLLGLRLVRLVQKMHQAMPPTPEGSQTAQAHGLTRTWVRLGTPLVR